MAIRLCVSRATTLGLVAGTALLSTLCAAPLAAQTIGAAPAGSDATQPQAARDSQGVGLGDIVVTASRREELARNVPVAVSAISGEKLDVLNSSGLDIRFLAARVPSLQVESSFGRTFPRFYIRGLGNTDFDPNAAQPVSVVLDDVALESPLLKSFPIFDVQNVQVLRGPQGTLFGRNTPAGVVKLDSAKPSDTFGGYASVNAGTYGTVNAEGAVGGGLGEGLDFRLSGLLQRRDDWVTNTDTAGLAKRKLEGYRDLAGRFQLGYSSGDFHALWNLHGRTLDGTPRVFRAGIFQKGSNHFVSGFDKDTVSLDGITDQTMTQWGTNLHLDYHFAGLGTLYSVTAYERAKVESIGDVDGGSCYAFIPGCTLGQINVGAFPSNTGDVIFPREFSQEVRFATDDLNGLRLQSGVYYFRQWLDYTETSFDGAGTLNGDIRHNNKNENVGLFGSAEYRLTPALTLRAGVRYSHDDKRDTVYQPQGFDNSAQVVLVQLPLTSRAKGNNVSWDASGTYTLNPHVSLYARVATGYLGPAIQDRVTFGSVPSIARKQTTLSAEGGIKGETADRRFNFALDGYWYRTKDFQVTAVGGASNSARLINADHAIGYGVEAELGARPVPNLTLTASGSWNFTQLRDPNLLVAACGGGCTVTDPTTVIGGTTYAYINGNALPQAPRYIANATARYGVPLPNGDEVFVYTDWSYRSKINYFLYEASEFRGRALVEGGAKLGYRFHGGIEVAAFARNILNQIRAISAIDFNNLTGMINDPRIIGGEVRVTF
ncbi:TonB-dependent receptor [Sphingomonas morindae]|uniref:TonB-dependent receptor n=1 Tax=Sphingomonas morindae TaxID=1541170 RepID=A0ABY4X6Z3_9SPHN|nr:TonB-dependent receptor [Sphingomonas morindae]USI72676.1 TonB-dependent receptor [Sphingomonas morindae]